MVRLQCAPIVNYFRYIFQQNLADGDFFLQHKVLKNGFFIDRQKNDKGSSFPGFALN